MKERFSRLCGVAAPLPAANVDTGLLAPAQWARDNPNNLGDGLFMEWRFDTEGKRIDHFVLNRPRYEKAEILIAGPNFGCGSSRETAVWAMMRYGFRCIVASSYGEIFEDNCYQNGLLPVRLDQETVEHLMEALESLEAPVICVDLVKRLIEVPGSDPIVFAISADRRTALLEGLDETLILRAAEADIAAFEGRDQQVRPWIYERPRRGAGL